MINLEILSLCLDITIIPPTIPYQAYTFGRAVVVANKIKVTQPATAPSIEPRDIYPETNAIGIPTNVALKPAIQESGI